MVMTSIKFHVTYNEFMGMELHYVTGMRDSYERMMEEARRAREEKNLP